MWVNAKSCNCGSLGLRPLAWLQTSAQTQSSRAKNGLAPEWFEVVLSCQNWLPNGSWMAHSTYIMVYAMRRFRRKGCLAPKCSMYRIYIPLHLFISKVWEYPWNIMELKRWIDYTSGSRALISWDGLHFGASDLQVCWMILRRKTHWYEAVSSALNFPLLKEVWQNCFVFDVVNFENWGSLADLFRFWCCQVQKLRKSRRFFSFLTLSSSKNWGLLAGLLRFQSYS